MMADSDRKAELLLRNLHYWWNEVRRMEPRIVGLPVESLLDDSLRPVQGGATSNPTETFALRHLAWLRPLARLRGVIYRLPPHLKQIYWLRYRKGLTRDEVSVEAHCPVRTVDRRLTVIRGRIGECLRRMKPDEREALNQVIRRFTGRRRQDPKSSPARKASRRRN